MDKTVRPAERISGEIKPPGDKSISHRVVFMGAVAEGTTKAKNFLMADDCMRTVDAFREMGIEAKVAGGEIKICGKGFKGLKAPSGELYLGNSGTTMRILPGILAGQDFEVTLTGDESLSSRPMKRIAEPLARMGVSVKYGKKEGTPPLIVKGGRVKPIDYDMSVASAQVKSCVLFAGLYADGLTRVREPFLSRDHTERMLSIFGAAVSRENLKVSVRGVARLKARELSVPGDISSAAFFIAAACMLRGSDITVRDVGLNPTRLGFLNVLSRMGADINIKEKKNLLPCGDISVRHAELKSAYIKKEEIPLLIDEVPILAVLCASVNGESVIEGISELRLKETDRISAMTENLLGMGVDIKTEGEKLVIRGGNKRFKKTALASFGDHRTAMSMAIAGLYADGESTVDDTACVSTSYPEFFDVLESLRR